MRKSKKSHFGKRDFFKFIYFAIRTAISKSLAE